MADLMNGNRRQRRFASLSRKVLAVRLFSIQDLTDGFVDLSYADRFHHEGAKPGFPCRFLANPLILSGDYVNGRLQPSIVDLSSPTLDFREQIENRFRKASEYDAPEGLSRAFSCRFRTRHKNRRPCMSLLRNRNSDRVYTGQK